jgi:hypothetical protein
MRAENWRFLPAVEMTDPSGTTKLSETAFEFHPWLKKIGVKIRIDTPKFQD